MAQPYLGEIKLLSFGFAPKGWAMCNGQLMSIQSNTALFSLLGTTYGGNGVQTFALPDLRSRVALSFGGVENYVLGGIGGKETVTLTTQQMPQHTHQFFGANPTSAAVERNPAAGLLAYDPSKTSPANFYASDAANLVALYDAPAPGTGFASILNTGGGQPHSNLQPYLAMNYCIALTGVFPARN